MSTTGLLTKDGKSIRSATVSRITKETSITCTLQLDHPVGVKQVIDVSTGIGFLDHVSSI
jgi:imidazoleglycerol-phosphate dehydratase